MHIYIAPLVTILGMILYLLASNPKTVELARIAYAFGLLVTLMQFASKAFHLP